MLRPRCEAFALGAALVLTFVVLFPYRHFAGDDAYISFRFAENLARGDGFSFNPGHPTYGSTSPLWVGLLAVACRAGLEVRAAAHALNALCVVALVVLWWRLAGFYLGSLGWRSLATAVLVLDPWFVHWSMSGMENALALALLVGVLLARQRRSGSGDLDVAAPVCCGLGILTRPEFSLLAALLAVDVLLFERRKSIRKLAVYAVVMGAIVVPWLVYARHEFHTIIPNTISAKLSAYRADALVRIMKYFASFYVFESAALVLFLALHGSALKEAFAEPDVRARWFLPAMWMPLLPAFYIAGGAPVGARYLVLGLPAYVLVGIKAWECLVRSATDWARNRTVVTAAAGLALAQLIVVQARFGWHVTRWPEGMDPRMIEMGRWLRANSAPGDLVEADQIGVIGFFSGRDVLDSGGLVSPQLQAPRRAGDAALWDAVRRESPQWLISVADKAYLAGLLGGSDGLQLVAVYTVQREGAGNATVSAQYNVYRTNWPTNVAVR
jgi:hypothetical protein